MIEKRFENRLDKSNVKFNTLNPVWDNKRNDALNVFEMIDELNTFEEENEQLKDKYNEQSVQYDGLEEQVERLLDFKDNVFNLINKKLKEADKGFEQTYDSWYQGQVDTLKELKKELQRND